MASDAIKKSSNGTYFFRANLGVDITGKKIQKYKSGFKTKKEAREEYSKIILMSTSDIIEDKNNNKVMFKDYISEIFLPYYKTQVKIRTYENRLTNINKHFKYFDTFEINKIEPIHVQAWQLSMIESLSPSYVRSVQGLFSLAMDRAVVLGIAKTNPSKIIGNVKKQKMKLIFGQRMNLRKLFPIYTPKIIINIFSLFLYGFYL